MTSLNTGPIIDTSNLDRALAAAKALTGVLRSSEVGRRAVAHSVWSRWAAPSRAARLYNKLTPGRPVNERQFTAAVVAYVSATGSETQKIDFALNCLLEEVAKSEGSPTLRYQPLYTTNYLDGMKRSSRKAFRFAMEQAVSTIAFDQYEFFRIDLTKGADE